MSVVTDSVLREVALRYSAVARRLHEALHELEPRLEAEDRAIVDDALEDVSAQLAALEDLLRAAAR